MFPFEQLEVYKKAYFINQKVYHLLREDRAIPPYAKNQSGRSSLSIMLNIAEGSAKFSARDRKNFFVIARGSVFECSSLISFLNDEKEIPDDLENELYPVFEDISRILYTMIKNLQIEERKRAESGPLFLFLFLFLIPGKSESRILKFEKKLSDGDFEFFKFSIWIFFGSWFLDLRSWREIEKISRYKITRTK